MKYSFMEYSIIKKEKLRISVSNSSEMITQFLPWKHLKPKMNITSVDFKTVNKSGDYHMFYYPRGGFKEKNTVVKQFTPTTSSCRGVLIGTRGLLSNFSK